jgi:hypothetical protein
MRFPFSVLQPLRRVTRVLTLMRPAKPSPRAPGGSRIKGDGPEWDCRRGSPTAATILYAPLLVSRAASP